MSTPTRLINYEDSLTMPENRCEEIVHGEVRLMPPAIKKHVYLIQALGKMLEAQLDPREHYVIYGGAGLGIERVPLTYRIPDLMVFRNQSLETDSAETAANDPYIWVAPELIVECLSPSNRKGSTQELLADYARIAVPEVWLIDPKLRQYTSYRFESSTLRESLTANSGRVSPLRMPNVAVELPALWAVFGA